LARCDPSAMTPVPCSFVSRVDALRRSGLRNLDQLVHNKFIELSYNVWNGYRRHLAIISTVKEPSRSRAEVKVFHLSGQKSIFAPEYFFIEVRFGIMKTSYYEIKNDTAQGLVDKLGKLILSTSLIYRSKWTYKLSIIDGSDEINQVAFQAIPNFFDFYFDDYSETNKLFCRLSKVAFH